MGCPKIVPKGNLSEMVSNWQISIGYEDNQIMTPSLSSPSPSSSGGPGSGSGSPGFTSVIRAWLGPGVFDGLWGGLSYL